MKKLIFLFIYFVMSSFSVFSQNITGGIDFSVYLDEDGMVYTSGDNTYGQLGNNTYQSSELFVPIYSNQLPAIKSVKSKGFHTLAIACDNTLWSWGLNCSGQLGIGEDGGGEQPPSCHENKNIPMQVLTGEQNDLSGFLKNVKIVSAFGANSYALTNDGKVLAWGDNSENQLQRNDLDYSSTPVYIRTPSGAVLENIVSVVSKDYGAYALAADGTVWAWGNHVSNDLGCNGCISTNLTKVQADYDGDQVSDGDLKGIKTLKAGATHALLVDSLGGLWSVGGDWGFGQRGNPINGYNDLDFATRVLTGQLKDSLETRYLSNVKVVAAGLAHSLSVVNYNGNGYLSSWGKNDGAGGSVSDGQLGLGQNPTSIPESYSGVGVPALVNKFHDESSNTIFTADQINIVDVSASEYATYAISYNDNNNKLQLWATGDNSYGQLGLGDKIKRYYFTLVDVSAHSIHPNCPQTDFNLPDTFYTCLDKDIFLNANTVGPNYEYSWKRNGESLSLISSEISVIDYGTYEIETSAFVSSCDEICPLSSDKVVIAPYNAPFIDESDTFCGDLAGYKIQSPNFNSFNFFDSKEMTNEIQVVFRDTIEEIINFRFNKNETSYNPLDNSYNVWVNSFNEYSDSLGKNLPTSNNLQQVNFNVNQELTVYQDVTIESVDLAIKSYLSDIQKSVQIKFYANQTRNGQNVPDLDNVLAEGDVVTKTISNTNTYQILTVPVNAYLIGSQEGKIYWAGVKIIDENGIQLFSDFSTTLWRKGANLDDIDGETVTITGSAKYGFREENEYGSFFNWKIKKVESYSCGLQQLSAQEFCPSHCEDIADPTISSDFIQECEANSEVQLMADYINHSDADSIRYQWIYQPVNGDTEVLYTSKIYKDYVLSLADNSRSGDYIFKTINYFRLPTESCVKADTAMVVIDVCTAINEVYYSEDTNKTIYPNPVKNRVYIEAEFESYVIYSSEGIVIKEGFNTGDFVSVEGLNKGVYFIRFDHNTRLNKFLKE